MSINIIRGVYIDGHPSSIRIQLGDKWISDKCYIQIGKNPEHWFAILNADRDVIVELGKKYLKERIVGKVTKSDGTDFDWDAIK